MSTQPGTGLTVFQQGGQLPAHIAHFFEEAGSNIKPRTTVPSLSPQGKQWTIALNGQKIPLQRRNQDGDMEPLPIMKVVVLDHAQYRGRAYYEGTYDPNKESAPICWSDDGVTPDASLPGPFPLGTQVEPGKSRKISAACNGCPMSVKGSKVDDRGKSTVACSQHKMLAVVPDPALGIKDIPPLRLKIAITSIWDEQSPDEAAQGWLAWDKYVAWLDARGCKHTAAIVTKMKFDHNAAYPKIFFAAERPLEAEELAVIGPLSKSPDTQKLLGGTWTPAGVDGVPREDQPVTTAVTEAAPTIQPAAAPPAAEPQYIMADGETFTREQYHQSGWTDAALLEHGKMTVLTAQPAAPAAPAAPAPAPAPEVAPIVVGEPVATAAAPTATAAEASPPAASAIVIDDTPPPAAVTAPAAVVEQAPAQAAQPAPAPTPQAPTPPAAAAAAATATPPVSTDVPENVAALLEEWK
jgi:hypothetical protein